MELITALSIMMFVAIIAAAFIITVLKAKQWIIFGIKLWLKPNQVIVQRSTPSGAIMLNVEKYKDMVAVRPGNKETETNIREIKHRDAQSGRPWHIIQEGQIENLDLRKRPAIQCARCGVQGNVKDKSFIVNDEERSVSVLEEHKPSLNQQLTNQVIENSFEVGRRFERRKAKLMGFPKEILLMLIIVIVAASVAGLFAYQNYTVLQEVAVKMGIPIQGLF